MRGSKKRQKEKRQKKKIHKSERWNKMKWHGYPVAKENYLSYWRLSLDGYKNCSHLGFFKAEANKYYVLCMEAFYGTDYCPLETGQTPLSKPHLWPQANVRPQGGSSPIKNTLPCPGCNTYFSLSFKVYLCQSPETAWLEPRW